MTKIRTILFATLALVMVFGVCSQQALAENHLQFHRYSIARGPVVSGGAVPNTTAPAVLQGIVAMGPLPLTSPPDPDSWPCFAPNPPCTDDPSGGLLVGEPEELWSLASCNNASCGQIYWTFETGTGSGTLAVAVKVTQGTGTSAKTILALSGTLGSVAANTIEYIVVDGAGFGPSFCPSCAAPVAGNATITTITKVGSVAAKGTRVITLQ